MRSLRLDWQTIDDGSTDGSAEAVRRLWPGCEILQTNNLFWARSMSLAEGNAPHREGDYLVWFNDDVTLFEDSFAQLKTVTAKHPDAIIVGAMVEPGGSQISYSGMDSRGPWRPLPPRVISPEGECRTVDTLNGNLVLVPRHVADRIRGVDPAFEHGFGDLDYGLRATRLGVRVILAPSPLGECARNSPIGTWQDPALPRSRRVGLLLSPKGVPIRSLIHFVRRHSGWRSPIVVTWIYLRILLQILRKR